MENDDRRLFFGMEVEAPWPVFWPKGRLLEEGDRHLTLCFLGDAPYTKIAAALKLKPPPIGSFSSCGRFSKALRLPVKNPRVLAWQVDWFDEKVPQLQKTVANWLLEHEFPVDQRPWLSHLTVCRNPQNPEEWEKVFKPLPCYTKALHLYESLGSSRYRPLWSFPFDPPFIEIEHTADIAFRIFGKTLLQLYQNALTALAFSFPLILDAMQSPKLQSLEDLIIQLNQAIFLIDQKIGCPFKAISFHGQIKKLSNHLLEWEMIVDV